MLLYIILLHMVLSAQGRECADPSRPETHADIPSKDQNPKKNDTVTIEEPVLSDPKKEDKEKIDKTDEKDPKKEDQEKIDKTDEKDPKKEGKEKIDKTDEKDPKKEGKEKIDKTDEKDPKKEDKEKIDKTDEKDPKKEDQEKIDKTDEKDPKKEDKEKIDKTDEKDPKKEDKEKIDKTDEKDPKKEDKEKIDKTDEKDPKKEDQEKIDKTDEKDSKKEDQEKIDKTDEKDKKDDEEKIDKPDEIEPKKNDSENSTEPAAKDENEKVKLQLYYGAESPDSVARYKELEEVLEELAPYLDISTYPYGNAHMKLTDSQLTIECENDTGCYSNKLHACAIDDLKEPTRYVPFNSCMMRFDATTTSSDEAADACGKELNVESESIKECAKGIRGFNHLLQNGNETENTKVKDKGIPSYYINDVPSTNSDKPLKKLLCDAFKNPPEVCKE